MRRATIDRITDWIVPVLLAGTVQMLFEIKTQLAEINKSLAVSSQILDEHGRRLSRLEEIIDRPVSEPAAR